jgi:type I restriction enzyme S subunit
MMNAKIALPNIGTQQAIAEFLDRETARLDMLIEKMRQLTAVQNNR